MAYVLSLMPHSPLAAPYQERRYERSWSSLGSNGTVQRHRTRQHSAGSLASAASLYSASWRSAEHETPLRSISYSDLAIGVSLPRQRTSSTISRLGLSTLSSSSDQLDKEVSPGPAVSLPSKEPETPSRRDTLALDLVHEEEDDSGADVDLCEALSWHTTAEGLPQTVTRELDQGSAIDAADPPHRPLQRWLSTLRRRKARHILPIAPSDPPAPGCQDHTVAHRKSESWTSSLDFVTAVKSASVTIASLSAGTLSRSGTRKSRRSLLYHNSQESDVRRSTDSSAPSWRSVVDEAARQRSMKRREKLEELIRTEESYVADLKALSNVCGAIQRHEAQTRLSLIRRTLLSYRLFRHTQHIPEPQRGAILRI